MKSIAIAMVLTSLIAASTVLTIYGHGDAVATGFVVVFFLFIMLGGSV